MANVQDMFSVSKTRTFNIGPQGDLRQLYGDLRLLLVLFLWNCGDLRSYEMCASVTSAQKQTGVLSKKTNKLTSLS